MGPATTSTHEHGCNMRVRGRSEEPCQEEERHLRVARAWLPCRKVHVAPGDLGQEISSSQSGTELSDGLPLVIPGNSST